MSVDRVNVSSSALERALQAAAPAKPGKPAEQSSPATVSNDEVRLSDVAKNAERIAGMVDESRASRLEEVRQALNAGTYRVSGDDIAKKLIELNKK
jgi:negative regulator of flagellin synthesis FlgM